MPDRKLLLVLIMVFSLNAQCWAIPGTPNIECMAGGTTYNTRPWILIRVSGVHSINHIQVVIDNTSDCSSPVYSYASTSYPANFYPLPATSGQLIRHRLNNGTALAAGTWYVRVYARCNSAGPRESSWSAIRSFTIVTSLPAGATETITDGTTVIRAAHFTDLRTCIANVRSLRNNAVYSYTYTPAANSMVHAVDMTQMRSALSAPVYVATGSAPSFTDSPSTSVLIRGIHIRELRTMLYYP